MHASSLRLVLPVAMLAAAITSPAIAQPGSLAIDCAPRALPSQRAVGEFLGMHNHGQVYAARSRLMAQAARACRGKAVQDVLLVLEARPATAIVPSAGLASVEASAVTP